MPGKSRQLLDTLHRDDGAPDIPAVIADGITASTSSVWAWVILPTRTTDEVNTDRLIQLTLEGSSALRRLLPKDSPFHVKIQWAKWSGEEYEREELAGFDEDPTEGQRAYIGLGSRRIETNRFPRRQVLLGVKLEMDHGPELPAALRRNTRRVAGEAAVIDDSALLLMRAAETAKSWHERMATSAFRARPALVHELAWSLRRDLRRTVDWLPAGQMAGRGQVARLVNGSYVQPQADHVEIDTDGGVRYLRCLCAAADGFPTTEMSLPGGEWLKELSITAEDDEDRTPAEPVEVSIRGVNLSRKAAIKRMREALALAKEQGRTAAEGVAEEPPEEIEEARDILPTRMAEVRRGNVSMVEDNVVWVVEADSVAALNRRTFAVIDHYGGQGISLWAPKHVQHVLWQETLLGDRLRFPDVQQFRPMSTMVGAWFHGGSEIGDARGPVLGANIGSTPGPFRCRLTDAALEGKPVTSVYVGQSGAGKSTAVMLSAGAEAIYGAWVFLTDFKGDLEGITTVVERFGVSVTRINTSEAGSGQMDPFRYVADPGRAASMCVDNLLVMLRESAGDLAEPLIRQAANHVASFDEPTARSSNAVIRVLAASEEPTATRLGRELLELARDPLARPLVGVPDPRVPGLPTGAGLVYMRYDDLRMPDRTTPRASWKAGERLSVALVQGSFDYANYMAARVSGIPKVIALTELHLVTGFDWGRGFVGRTARLGRALDNSLLLDTQATAELVAIEGLIDQVSAVYAFRVETDAEADAQALLLGLEPEATIRARQKSWLAGECEARDRHRRIAPVQWDYLDTEIAAALDTTPKRRRVQALATEGAA